MVLAPTSGTLGVCWESRARGSAPRSRKRLPEQDLCCSDSAPEVGAFKGRCRFSRFSNSPSTRPLPPSTSSSSSSRAGKASTPPFSSSFLGELPASLGPLLSFPGNKMSAVRPPFGTASGRRGRPLPQQAAPRGSRAPAFPYLTWTNACRQSQEFRPLTSASSSQGTARETEGRGWGRWEGRRGKGTNQQSLQPCRSFTFCLWVRSRAPRELSRDK